MDLLNKVRVVAKVYNQEDDESFALTAKMTFLWALNPHPVISRLPGF